MNVLILGSGGREHALAWKIAQSPLLDKLYCAPGNPGTAALAQNLALQVCDFEAIKQAVLTYNIRLVVVGPEEPLVKGIADYFENDAALRACKLIGPGSLAAQLEGSKDFAKMFMQRWQIPTAEYATFSGAQLAEAQAYLERIPSPYVLKADGLAAGKGVLILSDLEEARQELAQMLDGKFGEAGKKVVIERFLDGIELSVFFLTDGKSYKMLPEAKDYKRIGDGDTGPNTGGMGAVSPVPFADAAFMQKVEQRIVAPTVAGLAAEGLSYKGFVFVGLMNCQGEPSVIEYNVRMGDPETEAVLPRIESDLLSALWALAQGQLDQAELEISPATALGIVAVSGGYPGDYQKGYPIEGLSTVEDALLFHAGTKHGAEGQVQTSGGRVLVLTALAPSLLQARQAAYRSLEKLHFKDMAYRHDIGNDLLAYQSSL
jgi:phosphoribosylamine--glycine ligase